MPVDKPHEVICLIRKYIHHVLVRLLPAIRMSSQRSLSNLIGMAWYSYILFLSELVIFREDLLSELLKHQLADKVDGVSGYRDQFSTAFLCHRNILFKLKNLPADISTQDLANRFSSVNKLSIKTKCSLPKFSESLYEELWMALLREKEKMIEQDFQAYRFR